MTLLARIAAARKAKIARLKPQFGREDGEPRNLKSLEDGRPREANTKVAQRNKAVSPLLRLPAELRNHIYGYVLGGKSICLTSSDGVCIGEIAPCLTPPESGYNGNEEEHGALQLLYVCRQVHAEARLLIFSLNVFRYSKPLPHLELWKQKQPESMLLITIVRLYSNGCTKEAMWLEGLKYFPNLKRVELAVQRMGKRPEGQEAVNEGTDAQGPWEVGIEIRARKEASNHRVQVMFYRRWI
ncbi:uncharacterized protein K460DRAFT_349413 [Cucurbitaria berberidis CBS 394.84]|uniref:DUF7730 domain-containing protein n=1 Tax=Cucurbitaria berberidis CBS 394.84 TaxID=1168544 RepID=A0A9P4G6J4_9PLEO|nr:uncharacterized protein K460DRAFT_349413 [Cucurbitaria berberidis CBS 394.84]KAF1839924.1 hypothetical protein K460DRAFT_349413 [Cucurbitaria berberidis CBS 394.84]